MTQKKPKRPLNLSPVLLPYFDITSGDEGIQFALPARDYDMPMSQHLAERAGMDILLLPFTGEPRRVPHPIASLKEGRIPMPHWAWAPIKYDHDNMAWLRVSRPRRKEGSLPLMQLTKRRVRGERRLMFCTTAGLEHFDLKKTLFDVHNFRVYLDEGEHALTVGEHTLATLHVNANNQLLAVVPTTLAVKLDLWTVHLLRLVEVNHSYKP